MDPLKSSTKTGCEGSRMSLRYASSKLLITSRLEGNGSSTSSWLGKRLSGETSGRAGRRLVVVMIRRWTSAERRYATSLS